MTPDDPVAALRNLASALSECDECQAPTINDTDGPNSLCGKCWARHEALSAEIERMKAGLETVRVAFGYTVGGPSAPVEMAEEIARLRAEVERLRAVLVELRTFVAESMSREFAAKQTAIRANDLTVERVRQGRLNLLGDIQAALDTWEAKESSDAS